MPRGHAVELATRPCPAAPQLRVLGRLATGCQPRGDTLGGPDAPAGREEQVHYL
jgi:hypothetical protein